MTTEHGISGPHIQAAFMCEKVLREHDNVPSFIRVIERFNVAIPPPPEMLPPGIQFPPTIIQFFLVVMLKAGDLPERQVQHDVEAGRSKRRPLPEKKVGVFFSGSDENGVVMVSPVAIPNPDEGLYWFDVIFEEKVLTRVPMRILHQQMQGLPFPQ